MEREGMKAWHWVTSDLCNQKEEALSLHYFLCLCSQYSLGGQRCTIAAKRQRSAAVLNACFLDRQHQRLLGA